MLIASLSACFHVSYVWQASRGQMRLLRQAKPLSHVIADPSTSPRIKTLLSEVPKIKAFATTAGLTPTQNYQRYVDWDKPRVTWLITACQPLQFAVRTWRFPIIGTFPYLGWFDQAAAERHAKRLRQQGWDVYMRGVTAYSTLGWFHDPLISTMILPSKAARGVLVNTILHESVHATVFFPGQGTFNESLANFVADKLTQQYLTRHATVNQRRAYRQNRARLIVVRRQMYQAYLRLQALYQTKQNPQRKLKLKARWLATLRQRLQWSEPINNATVMQFRVYNAGGPAFERLLQHCHNQWKCFWARIKCIRPSDFSQVEQHDISHIIQKKKQCKIS